MARLPIPPAGTRSPPVCSIRAIRVVAIANPLRGLKSDTDDVAAVLKSVGGPIVLVGHSYAGSVIRNAATLVDNVVRLVFVAASAPDAGESAGHLAGRFPGSTLGDKLNMVDLPNGDVDLYVRQDTFWRQFCADRPESQANVMAVNQRPFYHRLHQRPSRRS